MYYSESNDAEEYGMKTLCSIDGECLGTDDNIEECDFYKEKNGCNGWCYFEKIKEHPFTGDVVYLCKNKDALKEVKKKEKEHHEKKL